MGEDGGMEGTPALRRRPVGLWLGGFVATFLVWAWMDSVFIYTNLVHWGPDHDFEFFSGRGTVNLSWSRNVWIRPSIQPPFREKPGEYHIMPEFGDSVLGEPQMIEIRETAPEVPCSLDWGYTWHWEVSGWGRPGLMVGRMPGNGMVQHAVRLPYWLLLALWLMIWLGGRWLIFRRLRRGISSRLQADPSTG